MRALILAALLALTALQALPQAAGAAPSQTWISGGSLREPIRFAAVDEEALYRRLNAPPKLSEPPATAGASYTIQTPYWGIVLPGRPGERPAAEDKALYYPAGGLVRARQNGNDVWLVLDDRQQAVIARYIGLGEKALIQAEPGILEVLRGDALAGGQVTVTLGTRVLTDGEKSRFWAQLPEAMRLRTPFAGLTDSDREYLRRQLASNERGQAGTGPPAWFTFDLAEGRAVRLLFDPDRSRLVDYTGEEVYSVAPTLLTQTFGAGADISAPGLTAVPVPGDQGAGSPLWWVVMAGGGLTLTGAAALLQRRLVAPRV